jgi:branched-subunit amino acid transport protein
MSGTALWAAVLGGSLGCYLLKLAGLSVPASWVEQPWVARVVDFVPAALLAALVAVQAVASGSDLVLDGRLVGLAVAAVALALRAPFIVVLVLAGAAGALVHVLAG